MTDAYEAYTKARGLRPVLVAGITLDEYTPMMSIGPGGSRADGATGALLGDLPATLLHSTYAESATRDGRTFTLVVATISEAVAFARNLSCRERKVQRDLARTELARFGDSREVELESAEFDERFALQAPPGIDASWLRQLFTPALIDWLTTNAPQGFCFELNEGHFCAAIPGHAEDAGVLDALVAAANRVAGRVREEATEGAGHESQAAELVRDDRFERMLGRVEFDSPPPDVGTAADRYMGIALRRPGHALRAIGSSFRHGPSLWALVALAAVALTLVLGHGSGWELGLNVAVWLIPVFIGALVVLVLNIRRQAKALATRLGEEAFVRGYAASRGLRVVDPAGFQVEHARLRLPGAVRHAMVGALPGTQLDGAIALVDSGVEKEAELSSSATGAIASSALGMFGFGVDDDRTYDAVVFEAPGAASANLDELSAAAAAGASESISRSVSGMRFGQGLDVKQAVGLFQAWQGGMGQRVIADGDTLACVRTASRTGRSANELDAACAQAAAVATRAAAHAAAG